MQLSTALLGYLAITVVLFLIFLRIGITLISSVVLALLIGQITLNILVLPTQIDPWEASSSAAALYYLIQIGTPLFLLVYLLIISFRDRRRNTICR
jgi:hypothetical protein